MQDFYPINNLGYVIVGLCIFITLLFIGLWAYKNSKNKSEENLSSELTLEKQVAEQDPLWKKALEEINLIQGSLDRDFEMLQKNLAQERYQVTANAELAKKLATKKQLPLTLFRIYEETRSYPKKQSDAKAEDLKWHKQIGLTDLFVDQLIVDVGLRVAFKLFSRDYVLSSKWHEYSQVKFLELTLLDGNKDACLIVRVRPEESESKILLEEAVIAMKSGAWLRDLLTCRMLMDVREAELVLRAKHQDVERLKKQFV
jgi:hypothetical protein